MDLTLGHVGHVVGWIEEEENMLSILILPDRTFYTREYSPFELQLLAKGTEKVEQLLPKRSDIRPTRIVTVPDEEFSFSGITD